MKSRYTCPACENKLDWSIGWLRCENTVCYSSVAVDGVTGDDESECYEQLKRRVEEEE